MSMNLGLSTVRLDQGRTNLQTLNFDSTPSNLIPADFSHFRDATNTPGTYFNSAGTLTNAVVNLATYSNTLSSWVDAGSTPAVQNALGIDGQLSAWSLTRSDGANEYRYIVPTVVIGQTYTFSGYLLKSSVTPYPVIGFENIGYEYYAINTLTGVATKVYDDRVGGNSTIAMADAGTHWRFAITWTQITNTTPSLILVPALSPDGTSFSYTTGGTNVFERMQFELGSTATTYIPTTTVPGGAPRGTYRYNGSAWVFDGTIVEAAATNSLLRSRALGTAPWTGTGTAAVQNATGIDGAANTAWTMTDASAAAFDGYYVSGAITIANDSNPHAISCRFLKDSDNTTFPALRCALTGGTPVYIDLVLNTSTGAFTVQQIAGAGGGAVEDEGLWWKATVYATNNSSGNTVCQANPIPAYTVGSTAFGASVAATRSCVVDQFDHRPNSTVTDSPIITAGVAVTRAADVLTGATSGKLENAQGFAAIGYRAISGATTAGNLVGATTGGIPIYVTGGSFQYSLWDGSVERTSGLATVASGTQVKVASTWGGSASRMAKDGVLGSAAGFDGSEDFGATLEIGGASTVPFSMVLQSLRLGTRGVTGSELAAWTA